MMRSMFTIALSAVLPAAVLATYNTYEVNVGANGKLAYDPEYVYANPGDVIKFNFFPKNHTVTQSAFDTPCTPLYGGVDSGFVPVAPDAIDQAPSFLVSVADYNPVWFHCQQPNPAPGHCAMGMVFAINPPAEHDPKSFSAFKALAQATAYEVAPPAEYVYGDDGYWYEDDIAAPYDHEIIVGVDGKLEYGPASIAAAIGDTVTFVFKPKNHTVTQSSFEYPCQPLEETSYDGTVGFKSGFKPVAPDATEFPTFQITIEDEKPIWGYCGQTGHCGQGMVFAINADEHSEKNFAAFKELAIKTAGGA